MILGEMKVGEIRTHRDMVMPEFDKWISTLDLKGKKVLELGCGLAFEFRNKFEQAGADWYGLDMEISCDKVYKGQMEAIPFPDKFFDYAFACHSFEHTQHPMVTLSQLKLKIKDQFMLLTPYHCRHQILEGDPTHFFCLTDIQMERLFRAIGIKKIDIHLQATEPKEQDWSLVTIGGCQ